MRLAYYSSIPCAPTFGGPLQIYRHFRERNDFDFIDLNVDTESIWVDWVGPRIAQSKVFKRLLRTRLYPWLLSRAYTTRLGKESEELACKIRESGAQAVVTVAYGRRCYVAREVAKILKLPLITFYHDWWPDLVHYKTPKTLAYMDECFRKLADDSDLIFPVSVELQQELETSTVGYVLPPIPGQSAAFEPCGNPISTPPNGFKLVYAGTLQGSYGEMLRELGFFIQDQDNSKWSLRAYGPAADWLDKDRVLLTTLGIYGGKLNQGSELQAALGAADALLVVMDFEKNYRRKVVTSFPSKILDYVQFEKPIIVWGPQESSAIRFVKEHKLGICVTQPDPTTLISSLEHAWTEDMRSNARESARILSAGYFNADQIQSSLKKAVMDTLGTSIHIGSNS